MRDPTEQETESKADRVDMIRPQQSEPIREADAAVADCIWHKDANTTSATSKQNDGGDDSCHQSSQDDLFAQRLPDTSQDTFPGNEIEEDYDKTSDAKLEEYFTNEGPTGSLPTDYSVQSETSDVSTVCDVRDEPMPDASLEQPSVNESNIEPEVSTRSDREAIKPNHPMSICHVMEDTNLNMRRNPPRQVSSLSKRGVLCRDDDNSGDFFVARKRVRTSHRNSKRNSSCEDVQDYADDGKQPISGRPMEPATQHASPFRVVVLKVSVSDEQLESRRFEIARHDDQPEDGDAVDPLSHSPNHIADPNDDENNLFGHPAARGCVACRQSDQPCSLLEQTPAWPCKLCLEVDVSCDFIMPLQKKGCCAECEIEQLDCSYIGNVPEASADCDNCLMNAKLCIAGPQDPKQLYRIGYDCEHKFSLCGSSSIKGAVTCPACTTADTLAEAHPESVTTKRIEDHELHVTEPLGHVEDNHQHSSIIHGDGDATRDVLCKDADQQFAHPMSEEDIKPITEIDIISQDHLLKSEPVAHSAALESSPQPPDASRPILKTSISKKFRDVFFDFPPQASYRPCFWCTTVDFGRDQSHIKETGRLRMCLDCCISRLSIAFCPHREFGTLIQDSKTEDEATIERGAYQKRVSRGSAGSDNKSPTTWCTLCAELAGFTCAIDLCGENDSGGSDKIEGSCGLALCRICFEEMQKKTQEAGLQDLIGEMRRIPENYQNRIRDDAEFLQIEGPLVKTFHELS